MQISTHTYIKRTALFIFATISLQTFCDIPSSSSTPNVFNATSTMNQFIANNPSAAARFLITPQPIHTATSIPNVGFFSPTFAIAVAVGIAKEKVVKGQVDYGKFYLSPIIGAAGISAGLGSSAAVSAAAATGSSAGLGAGASIGVGAAAGAAGAIIAVGAGGYYWYRRHQLKKIDYTPNYDSECKCEFPGMIGQCPPIMCHISEKIKKDNPEISRGIKPHHDDDIDNIILLTGPTGIGKTELAKAFAKETDSHFFEIYGADVPNSFIGGSANFINTQIATAIAEGAAKRKRVIIFIDEIDAFSSNCTDSAARAEYDAAYKALWRHVDNNKGNPNVFFIFATNHPKKIPSELHNRLDQCIVMKNPDAEQRKSLLNHFSKKYAKNEIKEYCTNNCMEKLIRETKNFSVRNISNLCKHAYQNACIKKEPISRKHLMQELNAEKQKLALQSAPTKEEQEEWDKWENRWIGRGNIFINFLNLVLHAAAKRA